MTIAIIGAGGQLGRALCGQLGADAIPLTHADVELTDEHSIAAALESHSPDAVINAAAYNLVDQAEDEPARAFAVNAFGPRLLAHACASRDIPLVHVSSDYVFGRDSHRETPYCESDRPEPLGVYASSKLTGEHLVLASHPASYVIRTCGLYGETPQPDRGNFVRTMLRLADERDELKIVNDQHCTPTSTADLAEAILALLPTGRHGLYHATNSGATTWYDFAQEIFRLADVDVRVTPIASEEFAAKAPRPPYSVLDCGKLADAIGKPMRPWQTALEESLRSDAASA